VIVIVTEQMLGRKPILDCLHRKARFTLCQLLLRPGEKGRYAGRRLGRNLRSEHRYEGAKPIEFVEFSQDRAKSGGSMILDVFGTRHKLAPTPLLPAPTLLLLTLEAHVRLCRSENR